MISHCKDKARTTIIEKLPGQSLLKDILVIRQHKLILINGFFFHIGKYLHANNYIMIND